MNESEMRRTIARKRDGEQLAAPVWHDLVPAYLAGRIGDAQMAAFLMACVLRGMTFEEAFALTEAFVASGETLVNPDARTVDKHSSGGVADTASLIVVPLVAACGVPVAKLSGAALGHTGGTLDKLEAIEGVRTDLGPELFFATVREVGCAIAAASARLAPADKRIYRLRDLTATIPALGLIGASIVSKKISGGARAIVYDVKVGRGAFFADVTTARALAEYLVALTQRFGRRAVALVTDMDEPLGPVIGTGLEALEARDFLRGTRRDPRLAGVVRALGHALLAVAGVSGDRDALLSAALESGAAYDRFEAMLAAQGAVPGALERLAPHPVSADVRADRDGYLATIDAVALGELARELAEEAGSGAGIGIRARTGSVVRCGDVMATVYGNAASLARASTAFEIASVAPPARPLVYYETGSREGATATPTGPGSLEAPRSTLERR